jgi:phenylalanyl-tRNA synthetase beta chain
MLVPFVHVGGTVRGDGNDVITLKSVKIRGEQSNGMIAAAEEIGLSSMFPPKASDGARPIIDLTVLNLNVGMQLAKALQLDDVTFHIDNHAITHRADLFSHRGIARECVALNLATWKKTKTKKRPVFPRKPLPFTMAKVDASLVPHYIGCLLEIDGIGETPAWMKKRLDAVGWRSLSLPIDITNFVASEIGVPLHSFDADDIKGTVTTRRAKKGERIVTLDGIARELPEGAPILSDDDGIFDLLGIMGGLRSSTKDTTRRIYLHAAVIDPISIRRTMIATGHRTDAGTVYEKGIAPITCEEGFYRALELFLDLVPGARIASSLTQHGTLGKPTTITLPKEMIEKTIGAKIAEKDIVRTLSNLGCAVKSAKDNFKVTPPLWRIKDLTRPIDVIEEIARIKGYNAITPAMPTALIAPPERNDVLHRLRDALKEAGFFETLHLSLTGSAVEVACKLDRTKVVTIANPLGEELSALRTSMLPALLKTTARELNTSDATKFFEIGHVFKGQDESNEIGTVVASKRAAPMNASPFLLLKRDIETALSAVGYPLTTDMDSAPVPLAHPGRSAVILYGKICVGRIFELHPSVQQAFGLPDRTACATIAWDALMKETARPVIIAPIPVFPDIRYDETIMLKTRALKEMVRRAQQIDPLIKSIDVVDIFEQGTERKITLRFVYRADDRTLTEQEAKTLHAAVMKIFA